MSDDREIGVCLGEDSVLEFAAGRLAGDALARAQRHIDGCDDCRMLVATASSDEHLDSTAPRLGRYVLEGVLGEGAMGRVYRALDTQLGRSVALKLVQGEGLGSRHALAQRLMREARAMAQLSHPNVVSVFDAGEVEGQLFVAMEWVPGMTLAAWLEQERSWQDTLRVFLQAGEGLRAAHAAGLIHRDFKPQNVLVASDGRARVTDFGLARVIEEADSTSDGEDGAASRSTDLHVALTHTGELLGTPAFMAPEQFRSAPADARTDQFSFCVALYRALYRTAPFAGRRLDELLVNVLAGNVHVPTTAGVPPQLFDIVRRGLSVEPADRYPSMAALLDELRNELRHTRSRLRSRLAFAAALALVIGGILRLVLYDAGTVAVADSVGSALATAPSASASVRPSESATVAVSASPRPRVWVDPARRARKPPAPSPRGLGTGEDALKPFGE